MPTAAANIATFLGLTFREITGVVASVTNHALTITGADNRILLVNPAFSRITGFSCAEFFGQEPFMWKTDRSSPDFYVETWPVLRDKGVWEGDLRNQNKAGQAFSEQPKSSGEVFHVARFTDVSSRVRLRLRQVKNRLTDGLTGLPNHLGFVNELRSALGRTSVPSVAVNVVNIDQFRRLGERAGHDAGDQLLNRIACALWRGCAHRRRSSGRRARWHRYGVRTWWPRAWRPPNSLVAASNSARGGTEMALCPRYAR